MPYILLSKIAKLCPPCRKIVIGKPRKPKKRGRKRVFDQDAILADLANGWTPAAVAAECGCSLKTVYRVRAEQETQKARTTCQK